MSYFAQIRVALEESQRRGTPFDLAWTRALRMVPRRADAGEGFTPGVMAFARKAFCEGYHGRDVLGGASILAEGDGWVGDHRVDGHSSAHALVIA